MPRLSHSNDRKMHVKKVTKLKQKQIDRIPNVELNCSHIQWMQPRPVIKDTVYCNHCKTYCEVSAIISNEMNKRKYE